ncbi:hypothetical protein [Fluviicola sp.]|uniref:hypothetical protein n=1 Tax=Fluviicola sp. TaxID=1917219 RepID=UPI002622852A|nr:hypothetical protein [Fluviicola sp.]
MKKILFGLMLLVSSTTFSQLDSLDFSMSFVTNPAFTPGLDDVSKQGNIFQVKVFVNDADYVGKLIVMVYDLPTNTPMAILKLDREQVLSETYTENGLLVFSFPYLNPDASYKVILESQNFQGAYLPRVEKNYPN